MEVTDKASTWRNAEAYAVTAARRMQAARLLNGLSLSEASIRVGYGGNKTQLSLIEKYGTTEGKEGRPAPVWAIIASANAYGVPLDYLFGLIEEVEVTQFGLERFALARKVSEELATIANRIGHQIARVSQAGMPAVMLARDLSAAAADWLAVFDRFLEKNRDAFDDMRVGNTLVVASEALRAAAKATNEALSLHDRISARALAVALGEADGTLPLFSDRSEGH